MRPQILQEFHLTKAQVLAKLTLLLMIFLYDNCRDSHRLILHQRASGYTEAPL